MAGKPATLELSLISLVSATDIDDVTEIMALHSWRNDTTFTPVLRLYKTIQEESVNNTSINYNLVKVGGYVSGMYVWKNDSADEMQRNYSRYLLEFGQTYTVILKMSRHISAENSVKFIRIGSTSTSGIKFHELLVYKEDPTGNYSQPVPRQYLQDKWTGTSIGTNVLASETYYDHTKLIGRITADPADNTFTYNSVYINGDVENNIFTYSNHGLIQNNPIYFNNNFTGVSANKLYMTNYIDTNTFKIKENVSDTENIVINEPTTNQPNTTSTNYEHGDTISISDINMEVVKGTGGIAKKELMSDNTNHKFSATHKPFLYDSLINKPTVIKLNKAYLKLQTTNINNTNNVMSKVREIYIVHRSTWPIHRWADTYIDNPDSNTFSSLAEKDRFHYEFVQGNRSDRYRLGTNLITIEDPDNDNKVLLQIGTISKSNSSNRRYETKTFTVHRISNERINLNNYWESSSDVSNPTDSNDIFTTMKGAGSYTYPYKWLHGTTERNVDPG